jgi:hypothetical protein
MLPLGNMQSTVRSSNSALALLKSTSQRWLTLKLTHTVSHKKSILRTIIRPPLRRIDASTPAAMCCPWRRQQTAPELRTQLASPNHRLSLSQSRKL